MSVLDHHTQLKEIYIPYQNHMAYWHSLQTEQYKF